MKTCIGCRMEKQLEEFRRKSQSSDGYQARCKACKAAMYLTTRGADAERNRRWRSANHEHNRERLRAWREANPEKVRGHVRSWQQANSDRMAPTARARQAVYRAIQRGDLVRPDACEQCGSGRNITAAHHNYQEPLSVRWLCRSCHTRWDAATPKTLVAS